MFLQKHSNNNFYLFFNDVITDKRKKVSLKTSDPKQAQKLLQKYLTFPHLIYSELMEQNSKFLDKKFDGLALDKIKPNIVYLDTLVKQYIHHSELNHTQKTHKAIQQTFKFFCAYLSGLDFKLLPKKTINDCILMVSKIELEKLSKQELEKYFVKRTDFSSIYQSRKDKINLSGFFTYLINNNVISDNPVSKIKLPKIPQKLPLYLDNNQLNEILQKTENEVLRDIFTVAYYTGMRLMEIVTLQYNMLDFGSRTIKLDNQNSGTITKSKKFRVIPMNSIVYDILLNLQSNAKSDFVFFDLLPQSDKSDFVTKQFKSIIRNTKLDKRYHFHNLRDSFATNLNIKGVGVTVIQKLLGHQNISTTMVYTHTNDLQLKDAINLL